MPRALIVSAGNNANEYLARHMADLGYTRPAMAASGGGTARLLGSASSAGAVDRTALKGVTVSLSSAPARAAVKGDINGDGAVDVYEMLAWAKAQREKDPGVFIAGIR